MNGKISAVLLSCGLLTFSGLAFAGGQKGSFDPSDINEPNSAGGVWRAYSAVDNTIWSSNPGKVSTVIAYSSNKGSTFSDSVVVTQGVDLGTSQWTQQSETPSLVYDSSDPGGAHYKVIATRFIQKSGNNDPTTMYLGMKGASNPASGWSSEVILLAGSIYVNANPTNLPVLSLSGTTAADCDIIQEPATLSHSSGFYLAFACHSTAGNHRVHLVKILHSGSNYVLQDKGSLVSMADANMFKATYSGTYPELQAQADLGGGPHLYTDANGITYLLVSPVKNDGVGSYMGCAVFKVNNLEPASIARNPDNSPRMLTYIQGTPNTMRGACSYAPHDRNIGISYDQYIAGASVPFTIQNSNVNTVTLTNVSQGKPTFALNTHPAYPSSAAVDGYLWSMWSAGVQTMYAGAQWLRVDLGANHLLGQVKLTACVSLGGNKAYQIQGSTDAVNYVILKSFTGTVSDGQVLDYQPDLVTGPIRYVLALIADSGSDWASLREFEAFSATTTYP